MAGWPPLLPPWTPVSTLGSSVLFSKGQTLPQQLFWRWPPYRGSSAPFLLFPQRDLGVLSSGPVRFHAFTGESGASQGPHPRPRATLEATTALHV